MSSRIHLRETRLRCKSRVGLLAARRAAGDEQSTEAACVERGVARYEIDGLGVRVRSSHNILRATALCGVVRNRKKEGVRRLIRVGWEGREALRGNAVGQTCQGLFTVEEICTSFEEI